MKRFNSVVKFSASNENSKDFISMTEDYARHYLAVKNSATKMSYDTKYSLDEKGDKLNALFCSELSRRSGKSLDTDFDGDVIAYSQSSSVAEMGAFLQKIMLDTVTPIVVNQQGLDRIAEIHYGGYGDIFEYNLKDDSIYAVSKMGRRQKHTKTQERKASTKTISTDMYGLTTYATLPQIILGDDHIAEDVMLKALSMTAKIYQLIIAEFTAQTAGITDTTLVQTNWDEVQFLTKMRSAKARNNAQMEIVGDMVALKSVLPDETRTRVLLGDEYNTRGFVSTFNGYTTMAFDAVSDGNDGVVGLPTNKIYGIPVNGDKLIQVAIGYTSTNTDDDYENDNLAVLSTLRKELGVALVTNRKVVRVDLA